MMKASKRFCLGSLFFLFCVCFGYAQVSVLGGLTRDRAANPGESYSGVIFIQNTGDENKTARIYLKDYLYSADGKVYYIDPGTHERSNADWISFFPGTTTVGPSERKEIRYTVNVPEDESLGVCRTCSPSISDFCT